jgi:hypothetical protein
VARNSATSSYASRPTGGVATPLAMGASLRALARSRPAGIRSSACAASRRLDRRNLSSSFRGAPLGASPESILPIVVMDSLMCNCTSKLAASRRPGMTEARMYRAPQLRSSSGRPHRPVAGGRRVPPAPKPVPPVPPPVRRCPPHP